MSDKVIRRIPILPLAAWEAITSVALSHYRDCDCKICLAAHGDAGAITEILDELAQA